MLGQGETHPSKECLVDEEKGQGANARNLKTLSQFRVTVIKCSREKEGISVRRVNIGPRRRTRPISSNLRRKKRKTSDLIALGQDGGPQPEEADWGGESK